MYEKDIPVCETDSNANTAFVFHEFQTKKRALAEESLIMSEKILGYLIGGNPAPMEQIATPNIDSFMADLLSEKDTLHKLCDNLACILRWLGA